MTFVIVMFLQPIIGDITYDRQSHLWECLFSLLTVYNRAKQLLLIKSGFGANYANRNNCPAGDSNWSLSVG